MNAIDGSDRHFADSNAPPPSLLTIILDTNPYAWSLLSPALPLSKAVANLLVFINAHLAINHANQVAVIASHTQRAVWLYPTPDPPRGSSSSHEATAANNGTLDIPQPTSDTNKYRPFHRVERAILTNLSHLLQATSPTSLASSTTTQTAGALTTALTYISKQTILASPGADPTAIDGSSLPLSDTLTVGDPTTTISNTDGTATRRVPLTARILILSVSGDLAAQYIPVMNAIFAAQRRGVAVDVLKLAGDTVFLQQACDATGGVYIGPGEKGGDDDADGAGGPAAGLLQYLMMAFLPDATARRSLVVPGAGGQVDFRAACFCHRRVVDVGFVCSVCLSIFCEVVPDGICLTCGTQLSLSDALTQAPAVVPRKKKKKKKGLGDGTPASTPTAGTPGPS